MTTVPERCCHLRKAILADEAHNRTEVDIEGATCTPQGITLKLKGVDTVQGADRLRNMSLLVQHDEVYTLLEGQSSIFDIVGLEVLTEREIDRYRKGKDNHSSYGEMA